jgi:hypothetical protein
MPTDQTATVTPRFLDRDSDCDASLDISFNEPINGRRVERHAVCTRNADHTGPHEGAGLAGQPITWDV